MAKAFFSSSWQGVYFVSMKWSACHFYQFKNCCYIIIDPFYLLRVKTVKWLEKIIASRWTDSEHHLSALSLIVFWVESQDHIPSFVLTDSGGALNFYMTHHKWFISWWMIVMYDTEKLNNIFSVHELNICVVAFFQDILCRMWTVILCLLQIIVCPNACTIKCSK